MANKAKSRKSAPKAKKLARQFLLGESPMFVAIDEYRRLRPDAVLARSVDLGCRLIRSPDDSAK